MSSLTVERITARELAAILKDPVRRQSVRIIDVRDSDFIGGHIRGAVNLPEDHFQDDDDVDAVVEDFKAVPQIVFHCMMSQIRGPFCAKRFKSRMEICLEDAPHKPDVRVLYGGFQLFGREYRNDPELVEDMDI
ncbi:hypothetical protein SDRG_06009 [Saprolegnia diclina VS20]|uniref:Rhodanese domain-containing protein n=1 Tax=Saprolegnia diclina (strain VS20) TaxID=1156394 RepID=T0RVT3_SAPDV|nr:hypothetical protein SDRG_06009 [Saprolegnia diclina VS20]EQC36563.1 hypothetical protein SDRG_06009 [Saprolegnia diclina VS20]|eukprot:XP_008609984.1 hypothetical protein SDRG_06009 [Saprolegnia diclina VS20]